MAELVDSNGVITLKDGNDFPRLIIASDGSLRTRDAVNETDGSVGNGGITPIVFSHTGDAVVGSGTLRWPVSTNIVIDEVIVTAGTAPSGSSLIVDVNKNGTTIFTTQANRPQVAAGAHITSSPAIPDVNTSVAGDYFQVDIDQIGNSIAGADVVVVIVVHLA